MYLDPKNKWVIKKDQEKLKYFQDKISLCYGSVKYITECILDLIGGADQTLTDIGISSTDLQSVA